jgi:hypothetical protein
MLEVTWREVAYSPYYRSHPRELVRLAYAKWLFRRHRLADPAAFLAAALGIKADQAFAGFEKWRPILEGVISLVRKEGGNQGEVSAEDTAILYGIVRASRPIYVVETGVAAGVSSSSIGAALIENGCGALYSIDLPPGESATRRHLDGSVFDWPKKGPGWAIPGEIKQQLGTRWKLILGDVRTALPKLLTTVPLVDMFFHDDLHTPDHMLWEYELVWPQISPGGLLVSDDANFAWIAFCRRHGLDGKSLVNVQRLAAVRKGTGE